MPPWLKREFDQRLLTWEPYWKVLYDATLHNMFQGSGLLASPVDSCSCNKTSASNNINGCAHHTFIIPPDSCKSLKIGSPIPTSYQNGDRRLILRSLPMKKPPSTYYKADTHTWPKGTFCQLNGTVIPNIVQRRQQSHDETLWKGNCHVLDLTPYFINSKENVLEILTTEYDKEHVFGFQIAICENRSTQAFLNELLPCLPSVPYALALAKAREYVLAQTVCLDDSSDDDEDYSSTVFQCFQLNCPISMKPIEVPVRGKNCKHMQCFDLNSFLGSNSFPSGRRWRCICCDALVSVYDLVRCELFDKMIQERTATNAFEKDKVELRGDGTWKLLEVKKEFASNTIRGSKKRGSSVGTDTDRGSMTPPSKKNKECNEVILLT